MQNDKLFLKVLDALNKKLILEDLILIGGWCLNVYKEYFNSERIPIKRTSDLDLLIPNPPKIKHEVNITELLENLDFHINYNRMNNIIKFVHPDLEVEFLMNQKGKGISDLYEVKKLSVTAVMLRYLSLLEDNIINVNYKNMKINVPEPSAFTLHKYILSNRRKNESKAVKDLETAIEMSGFLLTNEIEKEKIRIIFSRLNKKWKSTILKIVKDNHDQLYNLLIDI